MTLAERVADAQQRSVATYLSRVEVERQRQQLTQQAQALDLELVALDGEIRILTVLLTAAKGPDGQ